MQGGMGAFRARLVRSAGSYLCIWALALQMACYSYAPVQSSPPPQPREIGVVINDRGRVILGERVGALVDRIDGRIVSIDSQNVVMNVFRVTDLRGNGSTWTGEQVSIPREAILGYRERKVSKLKVLVLIGAAVLAVVTVLSTSLDVFGDPKTDPPGPPPEQS